MKPNALIIEDDPDIARLLGLLMERNDWAYEHVNRLSTGIKRANSHPFPEVILLDLSLPDAAPWQTVARIPDLMKNGPVLVLSNYEEPGLVERINELGAHYVLKDTSGTVVFDGVMQACRGWRQAQNVAKKTTDRIAVNLLEMRAIESKHANQ